MDKLFRIGDFIFRLICPEEVVPPENFMKFEWNAGSPEYTYSIEISERLPEPAGKIVAQRPDLTVYWEKSDADTEIRESRLIGVKGIPDFYACYREVSAERAEVTLARSRITRLHIDPVFTSLLALERRLVRRESMILHCAYVEYKGEAILFSAPSETGKTTQAGLWEKYRGSRTVNGDRALLGKTGGRWMAQGWPVCGTSEVCENEAIPVRAIVMLSQAEDNHAMVLKAGRAFPLVYSQITVNKWNTEAHIHTLDLIEDLLASVPVIHLGCTISEGAVECLERALIENAGISEKS